MEKGAAFFIDTHILLAMSKDDLEKQVKAKRASSWEALGDTQVFSIENQKVYAQLVVRVASNLGINLTVAA